MRLSRRIVIVTLVGAAVVAALAPAAMSRRAATGPVIVLKDKQFGPILTRRDHQALYYWNVEKKAGGKILCTGSCAKLWPPLIVKSAAAVPKTIPGAKGRFGVVKRPDGRFQVTYKGLAIYTYVHEGPNQVLCNNVDGWFVQRA